MVLDFKFLVMPCGMRIVLSVYRIKVVVIDLNAHVVLNLFSPVCCHEKSPQKGSDNALQLNCK